MTDPSFWPRLSFFLAILCYTAGIGLTALLTVPLNLLLILSGLYLIVFFLVGLLFHRAAYYFLVVLLLPVGYLYASWTMPFPSSLDISRYAGQGVVQLVGTIADEPLYEADRIRFVLRVSSVGTHKLEPVEGKILVTLKNPSAITLRYGQKILAEGKVHLPKGSRNPGDFSYKAYLNRQGIFSLLTVNTGQKIHILQEGGNPLLRVALLAKHRILQGHSQALSHPFDSLLGSIVLGAKASPIPKELQQSFRDLGLGHLLAVSGFQIAIILGACLSLGGLFQLPRLWIIGYTFPLILFYVLMTGAPPSVLRAATMAFIGLIGFYLGREKHLLSIAALSGAVLLVLNPLWFFDIGFQFSYLATFGLIYLAGPMAERMIFLPKAFASLLAVVFASQLVVLPLQFYYFNQFSWVAFPANLLASFLVFLITIVGFIASLLALFHPFLAFLPDWIALTLMLFLVQMVGLFKTLPGAVHFVPTPPLWLVLAYYLGLLVLLEGVRSTLFVMPLRRWVIFGLFFGAIYLWLPQVPNGRALMITFLDVGEGDATLIETPLGKTILVDAGTRSEYKGALFDVGERIILPYFYRKGINHIDLAIATHPDMDHIGGFISVLEKFPVYRILDSGQTDPDHIYQMFLEQIGRKHVPLLLAEEGMTIQVEPGLFLEILSPRYPFYQGTRSDSNSNAIIFRLVYQDRSIFFASDMEEVNEWDLVLSDKNFNSDILKVAHHGSQFSSSLPFLERVHPEVAIISVGKNLFGHPHPDTLARLEALGTSIYRTDTMGAIVVKIQDNQYQVEVLD